MAGPVQLADTVTRLPLGVATATSTPRVNLKARTRWQQSTPPTGSPTGAPAAAKRRTDETPAVAAVATPPTVPIEFADPAAAPGKRSQGGAELVPTLLQCSKVTTAKWHCRPRGVAARAAHRAGRHVVSGDLVPSTRWRMRALGGCAYAAW